MVKVLKIVGIAAAAVAAVLTYQIVAVSKEVSIASAAARDRVKSQYPAQAWAFDQWEQCAHSRSMEKPVLLKDCDDLVLKAAGERGTEVTSAVAKSLGDMHRATYEATVDILPSWPLSMLVSKDAE